MAKNTRKLNLKNKLSSSKKSNDALKDSFAFNDSKSIGEQMSPSLKRDFEKVMTHEAQIKLALKSKKALADFQKDPLKFLSNNKIPISSRLSKQLSKGTIKKDLTILKQHKITLPNGTTLKPKIKINIVQ
jgi:hypothetical protein